jgi:hypothetical protein
LELRERDRDRGNDREKDSRLLLGVEEYYHLSDLLYILPIRTTGVVVGGGKSKAAESSNK